ncbi:hypothetical protein B0H13DRAFT_1871388 [Mycena leptocephala]|nr:hypothetical protein B0H13DRAFT_1871388 [Mycena leptocephala]
MICLSSLLVTAASVCTALAVSPPAASLTGEWIITDYQGRFLSVVDTSGKNATPVHGVDDSTVSASKWLFMNTSTTNVFQIINVGTGTSLSYSTLITGGADIHAQIAVNQQATAWTFTPPQGRQVFGFCWRKLFTLLRRLIETNTTHAIRSWPHDVLSNPVSRAHV